MYGRMRFVDPWGWSAAAVAGEVTPADVVDEDENDVGFPGRPVRVTALPGHPPQTRSRVLNWDFLRLP